MNANDHVMLTCTITRRVRVSELVGLDDGVVDEVPEFGSPEWNEAVAWYQGDEAWIGESKQIHVTYKNPAKDRFPGTVPLIPEEEPAEWVTAELAS